MTSTALRVKGTLVQIASGTGGAKTISGTVVVGNPTIFTASAHAFNNGDSVTIAGVTGADAALVNGLAWTVQFKTTNTFAINLDSTGKTLTATGTATPNTYSTIGNAKDFSAVSGKTSIITVTNFLSTAVEKLAGLPDNGQFTTNLDLDNSDTGQLAAEAARISGNVTNFKIVLPSGTTPTLSFAGVVVGFDNKGVINSVAQGQITVEITGAVTRS